MCLVPKHMFHAHLESDSTDQTDILGSTSRVYIRQFTVGVWYLKRHVLNMHRLDRNHSLF